MLHNVAFDVIVTVRWWSAGGNVFHASLLFRSIINEGGWGFGLLFFLFLGRSGQVLHVCENHTGFWVGLAKPVEINEDFDT